MKRIIHALLQRPALVLLPVWLAMQLALYAWLGVKLVFDSRRYLSYARSMSEGTDAWHHIPGVLYSIYTAVLYLILRVWQLSPGAVIIFQVLVSGGGGSLPFSCHRTGDPEQNGSHIRNAALYLLARPAGLEFLHPYRIAVCEPGSLPVLLPGAEKLQQEYYPGYSCCRAAAGSVISPAQRLLSPAGLAGSGFLSNVF